MARERNNEPTLDATKTVTKQADSERSLGPQDSGSRREADRLRQGMTIGRYVVLRLLGAGGMGVVYAAYDPELDRRVALKLLLPQEEGSEAGSVGRARLLREAQALAKLNHPNVVSIHDVGEHEAGVWLAMEFVEGDTLRGWMDEGPHEWRKVVDVMSRAAKGLVAAHAKGLLHRDFKPDNVMVGADGRVRVMDFGLARADDSAEALDIDQIPNERALDLVLTRAGSVMGTPSYMAPEQHLATTTDARTDQFSFCVTLWEALFGKRPFPGTTLGELAVNVVGGKLRTPPSDRKVPAWLRRVCERGLSTKPEARFESMSALLEGIERGRARVRSKRVLAAAGVVLAAGAGVLGYQAHDEAQRIAACEEEANVIDEFWNEDARVRVAEGLRNTGIASADITVEKVLPWLDRRAQDWKTTRKEVCLAATVEHSISEDHYDKATWCLLDHRRILKGSIEQFETADKTRARSAVTLVSRWLPTQTCLDDKVLTNAPAPPDPEDRDAVAATRSKLARGTALVAEGKNDEGLELMREARAEAESIGWRPLVAEALRLEGGQLERASRLDEAEEVGIEGYSEAVRAGAWSNAVDAAARLCFSVGYSRARPEEGKLWCEHAKNAIVHAGDPLRLREARLLHSLGPVLDRAGDYAGAEAAFREALEIKEAAYGPDHPEVAQELSALANAIDSQGRREEALPLYHRALEIQRAELGDEHPKLATTLNNMATTLHEMNRLDETKAALDEALSIWESAYGSESQAVGMALNNLASIEGEREAWESAQALAQRSVDIKAKTVGEEHPSYALSLATLAGTYKAQERYDEALTLFEQTLAIEEAKLGADHPDLAVTLCDLGEIHVLRDEADKALPYLERALTKVEDREGVQDEEPRAHFWLARALDALEQDPERAIAEAKKAIAGAKELGGRAATKVPEYEAWLAEHQ